MWEQTPEEARAAYAFYAALGGDGGEVAEVEDLTCPGPAGPIPLRVYRPATDRDLPCLVYIHGGGHAIGGIDTHDPVCRQLARLAHVAVVSVEYRLAPEHPFPAGVEDCEAAVAWVATHPDEVGADTSRLAVGGDSAGANLSTVVSISARDRGGPAIAATLLVYPSTDWTMSHPSIEDNGEGGILTRDNIAWFRHQYLGPDGDVTDPRASPIRTRDLSGLPPALVITAELDPLRDEGEAYAARLEAAGVDVTCTRYEGQVHTFFGMGALFPRGDAAIAEAAAFVNKHLS
jgi:acetyl esterase